MVKPTCKSWESVPEHLKTKTQLGQLGMKPAAGQEVVAYKPSAYKRGRAYALYDMTKAVSKQPTSDKQKAALEKARRTVYTCDECGERVSKAETPICTDCRRAISRRNRARRESQEWARGILAQKFVILDTETADLWGEVISLAIINREGEPLYNGLFSPSTRVSRDATEVHGLTAEILTGQPSWAEEVSKIAAILNLAEVVIIYNSDFDLGRIAYTSKLYKCTSPMPPSLPVDCLMLQYAKFCGEWSEFRKEFRWQILPEGNHTALGDCTAALDLLYKMAGEEHE